MSPYHQWIIYDQGERYRQDLGYSTILSDAPFDNIDRMHMVYVGAIHLADHDEKAELKAIEDLAPLPTSEIKNPLMRAQAQQDEALLIAAGIKIERGEHEMKKYMGLTTRQILENYATCGAFKAQHFARADGPGYVVLASIDHPKKIERDLCYALQPIITGKSRDETVIKSFDTWITELTPISIRVF